MTFLTPLYALGLLALAAPIVAHLVRRRPRGEVPFGSLMFLSPSPPRLSRRSRLEHRFLLLLRATALALLALAFARPFLRRAAGLDPGGLEPRRVAVLIDTSASMRRGTLWPRAQALARRAIDDCRPGDQLALLAFDARTRPLLGFEESAALDPARRRAVARARLDRLEPSWRATDLGQALIDALAAVEDAGDARAKAGRTPRRVVLVGDLQQGSRLDALGGFEWPSDVELALATVRDDGGNAGLHRLADPVDAGPAPAPAPAGLRVRVANDPGSRVEAFRLRWADERGVESGKAIDVYVPPGESRVVRLPAPGGDGPRRSLRLSGDAHPFDNTAYFADEGREDVTVLYVGKDRADDPAGLLYYLGRVFIDTPRRAVRVLEASPSAPLAWEPARPPALVVVSGETTAGNVRRLGEFARGGGMLLYVAEAPGRLATLAALAGSPALDVEDAPAGRDAMLGEIAFDHPLFAPLAGPQFNDFTKIRFWKHRRIPAGSLAGARVLARFEDGDPAVLEEALGKGRLVVLASGWQPADSQLARSSKFVPLMAALLEGREPRPLDAASYRVDDRVPLPRADGPSAVRKPDGTVVAMALGDTSFAGTDQPGVYTIETRGGRRPFAVNLDPGESQTSPLPVEALEQLGCRLARRPRGPSDRESPRRRRDAELEGRQKLWRPLILASLGVLIVETWLAGRLGRPRPSLAEAPSS